MKGMNVGDQGQRYEVRFERKDDITYRTLGWTMTLKSARDMQKTWRKAPGVERVWIVDRCADHRNGGSVVA